MVVTYGHNSQVWKKFTEPGEPGNMAAQLQMQGRMVGTGMVSDPQSSSILRKLGVNSEVTRLPHRVLWTEAFLTSRRLLCIMHPEVRSHRLHLSSISPLAATVFPHQSSPHPVQQLSAWPQLSGVIKPLTIPVYSHRFRKRFRTSSAVWVLAKGASVLTCICANLAFAKSLI